MSSTRNWKNSFKRINIYTTYLLGTKALSTYIVTGILSFLLAVLIIYGTYAGISIFLSIMVFALVLILVSISTRIIDELNNGVSSLILSIGISRREYLLSWMLATLFYPVVIIALSILIPVLIISPNILIRGVMGGGPYPGIPIGLMAVAFSEQLYVNTVFALAFGVIYRRKGIAWLIAVSTTILIPVLSPIIASMVIISARIYQGYIIINLVIYYMNFLFNPFYATMAAHGYNPNDIVLPITTIVVSGMLGTIFTVALIHYVKHSLEV